jgi:hypothetical protein
MVCMKRGPLSHVRSLSRMHARHINIGYHKFERMFPQWLHYL